MSESPPAANANNPESAIVLVIDRLGAAFLGPYGNTWLDTPGFNRLAGNSYLFEQAWSNAVDLDSTYRAYWQGSWSGLVACSDDKSSDDKSSGNKGLPDGTRDLPTSPRQSVLVTDCKSLVDHPLAADFDEKIFVQTPEMNTPPADVGETQFARIISAALDRLEKSDRPLLLWIHAQAMNGPWDAPHDLRERFREEEDPPPYPGVAPPSEQLNPRDDPDRALTLTHAYAGHVAVIDLVLDMFLDNLDQLGWSEKAALIVTSPRGYALGEHQGVGRHGDDLYAEVLQVPLLLRVLPQTTHGTRVQALVQPVDLYATIRALLSPRNTPPALGRSLMELATTSSTEDSKAAYVVSSVDGRSAVRTSFWFYREGESAELYVKPDDRFEINEVADRCSDLVDEFATFTESVRTASPDSWPPLPDSLQRESG